MFKKNYSICINPEWSNEDVLIFKEILDEFGTVIKMTDISKREELPESDDGIIFILGTTSKRFRRMRIIMEELGHLKLHHVFSEWYV